MANTVEHVCRSDSLAANALVPSKSVAQEIKSQQPGGLREEDVKRAALEVKRVEEEQKKLMERVAQKGAGEGKEAGDGQGKGEEKEGCSGEDKAAEDLKSSSETLAEEAPAAAVEPVDEAVPAKSEETATPPSPPSTDASVPKKRTSPEPEEKPESAETMQGSDNKPTEEEPETKKSKLE